MERIKEQSIASKKIYACTTLTCNIGVYKYKRYTWRRTKSQYNANKISYCKAQHEEVQIWKKVCKRLLHWPQRKCLHGMKIVTSKCASMFHVRFQMRRAYDCMYGWRPADSNLWPCSDRQFALWGLKVRLCTSHLATRSFFEVANFWSTSHDGSKRTSNGRRKSCFDFFIALEVCDSCGCRIESFPVGCFHAEAGSGTSKREEGCWT